ncbi:hypothetical protein RB653_008222 [Dictyostelium firmibasis]|uniref:Transmembrane protein n=1 Tax=Dictyostelium firmibasis TaxID=79012 RepID=A0AAN7U4G0_9MYCE
MDLHKHNEKKRFDRDTKFTNSPEEIEKLINKFKQLKQNENENPKIKKNLEKFDIILPFEYSIFQILSERVELKSNFVYLLSTFEKFLELLDQFSEMALKSSKDRVSLLIFQKKIIEIENSHGEYKNLVSRVVLTLKNCPVPSNEKGIAQLNCEKDKTRMKKYVLLGLSSASSICGLAVILIGIGLAPFTGGITLLSTIAGIITVVTGSTATGAGIITGIAGTIYLKKKKIDIIKSIELLEKLAIQVEEFAASVSNNKSIKTQLENDFEILAQNELEFLNLFCCICCEILKDPVIIPLPNDKNLQFEIYCRDCITNWYNRGDKSLPKSRLPFKPSDYHEPDIKTRGDVIRFAKLIEEMRLRISKIITPTPEKQQEKQSSQLSGIETNSDFIVNKN